MIHLNNLIRSDFIECYLTLPCSPYKHGTSQGAGSLTKSANNSREEESSPPPHNPLLSNSPPPLVHQTTGLYGKNTRRTSKTVRTVDRVSLHSFSSDVKKQISRPAAQPDHQPIPHFFKSITRIEWLEHHTDFETELNKTDWQFQHVATYVTTILTRHGTYGESYS